MIGAGTKRKLLDLAAAIDREATGLRGDVTVCPSCGTNVYKDREQYKRRLELLAVARRLRRLASDRVSRRVDGT